jgi:hypothetical protein
MIADFQVRKTGLRGREWQTVCRGPEARPREVFARQLRYYSIGRFRLLDPDGRVIDEETARPLFARGAEPA